MALIILDRDGVINFDSEDYIKSPDEWRPIPGSLEAIARLCRANFRVVLATNQSGIGRGLFDVDTLNRIHQKTPLELVERGDTKENIKEYNAKRPKYIAGRKRELKVGDYVRVLIKKFKESLAYKTYKGM